jgi:hypothetical protein
MIKIIKERGYESRAWLQHNFHWEDKPDSGFTFEVNEKGECITENDSAQENFVLCKTGLITSGTGGKIVDGGVRKVSHKYATNAVGVCVCGEQVELYNQYMRACECSNCGQWYNLSGQELMPPRYWHDDGGDWEDDYVYA